MTSTADLETVAQWGRNEQLEWLADRARAESADKNWWLHVIELATGRATRLKPIDPAERGDMLRLGLAAIDSASQAGEMDAREVATRLANLSVALERHGDPANYDPRLDIDAIAREVLAVIDLQPSEAESLASSDWGSLGVENLLRLRRVKEAINAFVYSTRTVRDPQIRARVEEWLRIRPSLP